MSASLLSRAVVGSAIIATTFGAALPNITEQAIWAPDIGSTYQIVLQGAVSISGGRAVPDVDIFDIDLFDTPSEVVTGLKNLGKKVMCYFSAGTSEDWRPDFASFRNEDKGACLPQWPGERWLNIKSQAVFDVQARRIAKAAELGCDAIDPDNMDGYSNENAGGIGLTTQDSVNYLRKLADEAAKYGMSIGLKNSQAIIPYVKDFIQFAVNEECALGGDYGDCAPYKGFGKPVYHIEYVQSHSVGSSQRSSLCLAGSPIEGFTTVIKELALDGWVMYCDGNSATTPTTETGKRKAQQEC